MEAAIRLEGTKIEGFLVGLSAGVLLAYVFRFRDESGDYVGNQVHTSDARLGVWDKGSPSAGGDQARTT